MYSQKPQNPPKKAVTDRTSLVVVIENWGGGRGWRDWRERGERGDM